MKTQLIPLESHDDLISIRDRMSWAKTPRILLVWPKSERISLRSLDLKVLQRHSATLGAQLGLVTRHRNIWREARALGIPVFISTGQAQRSPWPERTRKRKRMRRTSRQKLLEKRRQARVGTEAWQQLPLVRITFFSLGVLAVLVMASLFIPHAQVILAPEIKTQTATLPILADPSVNGVFITGSIPSHELRLVAEGNQGAPVSGKMPLPQNKAQGVVTFRNLTDAPVTIDAGAVLTSTGLPGVRFQTVGKAELEAGLKATVDVPIEAVNAGAAGNVPAGSILAIEGDLGLKATVTNAKPTKGGSDRTVAAATETDMANLREDLLSKLMDQARGEMKARLAPGDQLFPNTLKVGEVLEESYDPPLGQAGSQVTLSMRVEFVASYASEKDLTELAGTVLNASLPDGFVATQSSLDFEPLDAFATDERGVTRWSLRVSRPLEKRVDPAKIIPLIQGRSMENAAGRLEQILNLATSPEIRIAPRWWPWLPLIPFNISVETR